MQNKYKVVALTGKSGCGKDYILNQFLSTSFEAQYCNKIKTFTTRPIRENETDGVDYDFYNMEKVTKLLLDPSATVEATCFNNWVYGTELKALSCFKINIGIYSPAACEILKDDYRINLLTINICSPDKLRLLRQLNREENPNVDEIVRRYEADKNDFRYFSSDEFIINDGKKPIEELIAELEAQIKSRFGQK